MEEITFTLTEQDYQDLRAAIESATVQGTMSEVRKIVIRFTILRQKLEEQHEHITSGKSKEHGDGAQDSDINNGIAEDGDVGGGDVRN